MKEKSTSIYSRADRKKVASIVVFIVLLLNAATLIFVFFWGLLTSLKRVTDFHFNKFGLPENWMFSNFVTAFEVLTVPVQAGGGTRDVRLIEMIFNSVLLSIAPMVLVLVTALCMYTLAKYKFRGRNFIYNTFIIVMVLPIIGSLPSVLQFRYSLNAYDKLWFIFMTSPFTVWGGPWLILYATFKSLSWEFAEAAIIDGAGHHRIFWTIMLPMVRTVILVLLLLAFIGSWNDYSLSLIYLPSYPTLSYGLWDFQSSSSNQATLTVQLAVAMMASVPGLILFFIFKNNMMGSLTVGGLKG